MSIHNLGTYIGQGMRFENPHLDSKLNDVLDWLQDTGFGLGEVIDRIQHLAACRTILANNQKLSGTGRRPPKNSLSLDPNVISDLRMAGMTYREIARELGCSIGAVYKYDPANSGKTRNDTIKDGGIQGSET